MKYGKFTRHFQLLTIDCMFVHIKVELCEHSDKQARAVMYTVQYCIDIALIKHEHNTKSCTKL
jgi:hypothetical protein